MNHKAQAAMEFLMTYGWAILVVLVVIGALAYFGVLNPQNMLPDRCEMQQGFYCRDHRIVDVADAGVDYIQFNFENGRGSGMMIRGVTLRGTGELANVQCGTNAVVHTAALTNCNDFDENGDGDFNDDDIGDIICPCCFWAGKTGYHIENGATGLIQVQCSPHSFDNLDGSGKKKFDIEIMWYDASSTEEFIHTMNGQLLAGVETK